MSPAELQSEPFQDKTVTDALLDGGIPHAVMLDYLQATIARLESDSHYSAALRSICDIHKEARRPKNLRSECEQCGEEMFLKVGRKFQFMGLWFQVVSDSTSQQLALLNFFSQCKNGHVFILNQASPSLLDIPQHAYLQRREELTEEVI